MNPVSIHFLLDPTKPDEARVLSLLEDWQRSGWHMQKIIITALLLLANSPTDSSYQADDRDLKDLHRTMLNLQDQNEMTLVRTNELLDQTAELLHYIENLAQNRPATDPAQPEEEEDDAERVSQTFIDSLRRGVKRGFSPDEMPD